MPARITIKKKAIITLLFKCFVFFMYFPPFLLSAEGKKIFNLLPIPALDGGRLLFILIEMIFRKPVPQKYEAIVHAVGFALLIGFMLLITAKDIWTLIAG